MSAGVINVFLPQTGIDWCWFVWPTLEFHKCTELHYFTLNSPNKY